MSADSALELAKLLIDNPHIAEAMKGMAVVCNTYSNNGPTTVYIGCSFGGNGGGGNSPSSKGRKNKGRPTVTLDTSAEDEEVADEDEGDGEDTSLIPTPADATSTPAPAPVEAPQMGYQEACKIWARLDGLSNDGEIDEKVPSVNDLKVAHLNWVQAFNVADDRLNAVITAFNADSSSLPSPF